MSLTVLDTEGDSGSQGSIFVSLTNDQPVSGFQFVISDLPDVLSYVDVLPTDRTVDFSVSAAEGEGGVTLLGFSFTGGVIPQGCGLLTELTLSDLDAAEGLSSITCAVGSSGTESLTLEYYTGP